MMALFTIFLLGCIAQVIKGQAYQPYGTHVPLPVVTPTTSTVTVQTTLTHTLRETTTSDVWVTEQTAITLTVTQTTTQWDFVPQYPQTVTSVIRVTSTPVVVETATVGVNPVSTMVSIYSQFVTTTDTVKYWQTITHVAVTHEIQTVPVVTTQELFQEIVTTVTQIVTTTVTSTTARYYA
ncbi:hepatitis A virus cellular receptor 1-like [Procambarus clarkii]|uniref:hepatitis A virus cellular receptor 1-like n=1 Tax=Procambarus clarkii TaxID=6728 RepID=UPI00374257F2